MPDRFSCSSGSPARRDERHALKGVPYTSRALAYCVGMRSLCLVLGFFAAVAAQSGSPESGGRDEADRLYADRTNIASARRAAALWSAGLQRNAQDVEAAWKLSRADYWLGGHAPDAERRQFLESGVDAGKAAVASAPNRPEGHFWLAANMGAIAESYGVRAGLKYRKLIKEELDTVLRLDASFMRGSADRALGRWYFKVPTLLGGNRKLAEEHLRASLQYRPEQHRLACLPRRAAGRRSPRCGRPRRAAIGVGGPVRSGMGPGKSGVQAESPSADRDTQAVRLHCKIRCSAGLQPCLTLRT